MRMIMIFSKIAYIYHFGDVAREKCGKSDRTILHTAKIPH